jgi:hypothetical protein
MARYVNPEPEPEVPAAPEELGDAGRELWDEINRDLVLDGRETALLLRACQMADRAAELENLVRSDGLMVPGSTGRQRLHPALAEQRQTIATVGRLLRDLMPRAETPAQRRAVRAARRRWNA